MKKLFIIIFLLLLIKVFTAETQTKIIDLQFTINNITARLNKLEELKPPEIKWNSLFTSMIGLVIAYDYLSVSDEYKNILPDETKKMKTRGIIFLSISIGPLIDFGVSVYKRIVYEQALHPQPHQPGTSDDSTPESYDDRER